MTGTEAVEETDNVDTATFEVTVGVKLGKDIEVVWGIVSVDDVDVVASFDTIDTNTEDQ